MMTGAGLSAARHSAIAGVTPVQSSDPVALANYVQALQLADSTAIVTYIQGNAIVSTAVTIPVTSTAGSPSAGTGTGTVT